MCSMDVVSYSSKNRGAVVKLTSSMVVFLGECRHCIPGSRLLWKVFGCIVYVLSSVGTREVQSTCISTLKNVSLFGFVAILLDMLV